MTRKTALITCALVFLAACNGKSGRPGAGFSPNFSGYPATPFTITDPAKLIGGPVAIGRVGDVLLDNDQIRVIIQKPGKNAGLGSFGGTIIDADRNGGSGDQFGELFPLINVEWTINYYNYEVIADGSDGGPKVLRAHGRIDVYDYLDVDFIADVAAGTVGQHISFSNRFDDRRDPFNIYDDLKGVDPEVITDYTLEPGKRSVKIETTIKNQGSKDAVLPVGEFVNGSGQLSLLIPGVGFSPELMTQVAAVTPAVIYAGYDGVSVSYGYFYDPREFLDPTSGAAYPTTSLTYSGLTGVLFGESFLKLLPLGENIPPEIHFTIPAGGERKMTSYFVVGDGSAGSVLESGLAALGVTIAAVSGTVSDGTDQPVAGAVVALKNKGGGTVATYRTDSAGHFAGQLPAGDDALAQSFGKGVYEAAVDVPGFHANGTNNAGACLPAVIDLHAGPGRVVCRLGESGTVALAAPVVDGSTGEVIAARLTIVGEDPSQNVAGSVGIFYDNDLLARPFGIVDVKYLAANGTIGLTGQTAFALEPGTYRFVISHGTEYGIDERVMEIAAGQTVTIPAVTLKHVVPTPGFISADFHLHSIRSPDSTITLEERVLTASAEGVDILQSSDHDYLTDYEPVVVALVDRGLIPPSGMKTSVGDEITPNQYGHLHAFPLKHNADDVAGGALDWTASPLDEVSTAPDYGMSPVGIAAAVRADPGEKVVQINHISDSQGGLPTATGWVTSPFYADTFGVTPLMSYADPVERRLAVDGLSPLFPKPFGSSELVIVDATACELTIGQHLNNNDDFLRSALPTWFNFLNLGMKMTATGDSDSHDQIATPLGMPRNFIASSIDPQDGAGHVGDIDLEEYAHNINQGRVVISAGPFVTVQARAEDGSLSGIGDTAVGKHIELTMHATAASWAWFDTVEIYANTEPIPVDDKTGEPMTGTAADPATFYKPYHVPRYTYQPTKSFRLIDGSLTDWQEKDGVITATVKVSLTFTEDSWIVVLVRGTRETQGYRSLFPVVTDALVDAKQKPDNIDPADLTSFHRDKKVGAAAWALVNPIYVDVDGDGFQAKYIRDGRSPLAH